MEERKERLFQAIEEIEVTKEKIKDLAPEFGDEINQLFEAVFSLLSCIVSLQDSRIDLNNARWKNLQKRS